MKRDKERKWDWRTNERTNESCETLKILVRIDHGSVVCDKRYYQAG